MFSMQYQLHKSQDQTAHVAIICMRVDCKYVCACVCACEGVWMCVDVCVCVQTFKKFLWVILIYNKLMLCYVTS